MRSLFIAFLFVIVLIAFSEAKPKDEPKQPRQGPAVKIFEFLDKKHEGKVPVGDAKTEIKKILPLSDDNSIDADGDGFVTLAEFKKFYVAQYREWKSSNLKHTE